MPPNKHEKQKSNP